MPRTADYDHLVVDFEHQFHVVDIFYVLDDVDDARGGDDNHIDVDHDPHDDYDHAR